MGLAMRNGAQRASGRLLARPRRSIALFISVAVLGVSMAGPAPAAGSGGPKVAVIVGPAGSQTAGNRVWADAVAQEALRYTSDVVKVYSPRATWSRVKTAITGASIVVYIGQGYGYPLEYASTRKTSVQNGFGLNPLSGVDDTATRFYGESYVRQVQLAPAAVVILSKVPYSSGNGDPDNLQPTLSVARSRVDDYGAGFLAAGASVVIAEAAHPPTYYVRGIFTKDTKLGTLWLDAPTNHGNVKSFRSSRTPGAVGQTDPVFADWGYHRAIVGRLTTQTSAVRDPTREPYGMAIEMDGLGNWQVGGPNGQPDRLVAYRFRATTSSALASIQVAFPNMNPGYAAGTGGTLEISLRSDDGTAGHFPSGAILAKTSIRPGEIIPTTNWPRIAFPTPAQLTAGTLYHIVFRNTDPDPAANFVSVDDIHLNPPFGSPIQPKYANVDWALVYRPTAGADWLYQTDYAPILGLHYANGHVAGTAYVYSDLGSPKPISGSSKVRETFTVSGADRTVSSVGVRLKWISGTSPLTVRLETSGGSEIETVTIPAAALTTSGYAVRATAAFAAPRTLAAGQTYHLVLSSSGSYRAFAPYEGSAYGKWDPRTYFADGHAQSTTGAGWLDWGGRTDHDLQFYLE